MCTVPTVMYRMNIIWLMASFWMLAFEYFHRNIADGVACMYETAISTPIQVYSLLCMHKSAHAYIHPHTPKEAEIHSCGWRYDGNIFIIFLCSQSVVLICLSHFDTRISGSVVPWKMLSALRSYASNNAPFDQPYCTIQSNPCHRI